MIFIFTGSIYVCFTCLPIWNSRNKIALLVPIAGRTGMHSNPDLLVAMVTVAFGLLITAFIVCPILFFERKRAICLNPFSHYWQFPLASLVRHARRILFLLMAIHLIVVLAIMFTPMGFPYSTGLVDVKPQRVQILVNWPKPYFLKWWISMPHSKISIFWFILARRAKFLRVKRFRSPPGVWLLALRLGSSYQTGTTNTSGTERGCSPSRRITLSHSALLRPTLLLPLTEKNQVIHHLF